MLWNVTESDLCIGRWKVTQHLLITLKISLAESGLRGSEVAYLFPYPDESSVFMTSRSGGLIVAMGGLSVKSTTEAKRKIRDVSVFKYWKKEKLVIIKKWAISTQVKDR